MTQTSVSKRRNWRWAVLLALFTGLLVWLLLARWRESGFDWAAFAATFAGLRWEWIVAATAFGLSTYGGRALRWQVMLRPLTPHPNLLNLIKATAIGFTAVVLFGRPGEIVRPYLISVKEKVSLSSQLAAWMLERILDLLAVLLVFGLSLTRIQPETVGPRMSWVLQVGGYVAGVTGFICVVILFLLRRYSDSMKSRLLAGLGFLPQRYLGRAERLVSAFIEGLEATRNPFYLTLLFAYTVLEWVLIAACYFSLFKGFPETSGFGWKETFVFMGFVSFGSIFQIPGVGGGVQLVTVVVLTELFAVQLELATSIALLTWLLTFVVILPPGLFLAFHEGLNWKRLRHLEAEGDL